MSSSLNGTGVSFSDGTSQATAVNTVNTKSASSGAINGVLVAATAVSASGSSVIDFTGIPSWVKRITVMFNNVSLTASNDVWVRLGTAGTGIYTSGYKCGAASMAGTGYANDTTVAVTSGLTSSQIVSGAVFIYNVGSNNWSGNFQVTRYNSNGFQGAFGITLDGPPTTVRVLESAGNTFDLGTITIMYE